MVAGYAALERPASILAVEGDYLVALDLAEMLEEAGAQIVGPVGWLEEAIAMIQDGGEAFDSAILDVHRHGRASYPIADALIAALAEA